MANIEIANAQYNDVPSIEVPLQGGGTASFLDTSDGDVIADDVSTGKICYSNGQRIVGTRSGGGGGLSFTLLWEDDNGWNSGQITLDYSWKNYDVLFFVTARPSESPTSNSPYVTQNFLLTYYIKLNPVRHLLYNYGQRYMSFTFTDDTTLTAGNGSDLKVYKIYGINIG